MMAMRFGCTRRSLYFAAVLAFVFPIAMPAQGRDLLQRFQPPIAATRNFSALLFQQEQPARETHPPMDAHKKTKIGFLAAAGLVVISLLALATAVALVRAFKR